MKKENKRNYLIDGFPSDKQNVHGWDKTMSDKVNLQCVLVFDCDEKVRRIIVRDALCSFDVHIIDI